jgi:hypothetical protein
MEDTIDLKVYNNGREKDLLSSPVAQLPKRNTDLEEVRSMKNLVKITEEDVPEPRSIETKPAIIGQ